MYENKLLVTSGEKTQNTAGTSKERTRKVSIATPDNSNRIHCKNQTVLEILYERRLNKINSRQLSSLPMKSINPY